MKHSQLLLPFDRAIQTLAVALTILSASACSRAAVRENNPKTEAIIASPAVAVDQQILKARGDEPAWTLTIMQSGLTFEGDYGALKFNGPLVPSDPIDPNQYIARSDGKTIVVIVTNAVCLSSMTGMPFQANVTVTFGARSFKGCGGQPRDFLEGKRWRHIEVVGKDLGSKDLNVIFQHHEGSPLLVVGPCGRRVNSWVLSNEGLNLLMREPSGFAACSRQEKTSEKLLIEVLSRVTRFGVTPDWSIILIAGDKPVAVLSDPETIDSRWE